jgi:3-oxoacyl-[acyl-carrier protein] reductase
MMTRPWALILGASSGTGAAIAEAVARDPGLDIFGVHRGNHPDGAAAVAQRVEAAGRTARFYLGDAGTAEGAALGARALLEAAGTRSVRLFVHSIANASVGRLASGGADQLRPYQFQKTLESMASSFVYWTQELLSHDLLAPNARLLGLSNPMTDTVLRGTALIAASKAALEMYVRHLAHELGPRGVHVNLLKFGAVITPAIERTLGAARLDSLQRMLRRAVPAGRVSSTGEVARFVSVLSGDAASWFNGATIDFTGGESQALMERLLEMYTEERR